LAADPVPMPTLLGRLAAYRSLGQLASDPTNLLALASHPAWDLHRPRSWADLLETVDLVLQRAIDAVTASSR